MVQPHTYSRTLHNKVVGIIGPLPPPLGGVSVHVERTIYALKTQGNVVHHFDPERIYCYAWMRGACMKYVAFVLYMVRLMVWLVRYRPRVVMYHIFYKRSLIPELFLLICIKKVMGSNLVLVDHDCRHMYERTEHWKRVYKYLLMSVDQLILIGSVTHQSYADAGIGQMQSTQVESAFLPPDMSQRAALIRSYPEALFSFLRNRSPRIMVNAYQCVLWHGKDLYGLDQSISVTARLREVYPTIGLVIVLATQGDMIYYQQLCGMITHYDLSQHVYIVQGNYLLWPLFAYVDLFIRPTLSDGASVSVQEALFCGVSTIASDVCWRPDGVIVYSSADLIDLQHKIKQVFTMAEK